MSTCQHIAQRAAQVLVRRLCQALRVAPAAYTPSSSRGLSRPGKLLYARPLRITTSAMARVGCASKCKFGDHAVGHWRIRRVLRAHGLRAKQPRSFVPRTTNSDPAVRAAPNRLLGQAAPTALNRVWVGDITYLPRQGGGWLYLAVWLDRCWRKIVGWDVRNTMLEDLVSEALRRVLAVCRPAAGLIVHSDQDSQYTVTRFKRLLARRGAQQRMSRRGNCYDNALPGTTHAESFWSRFTAELLDGGSFPGLEEARLEISHHIAYYNAER